jgi:hypothetical protein
MPSLTALLSKWPVIRQIRERTDGTGLEAMSDKTRAMHARIDDARSGYTTRRFLTLSIASGASASLLISRNSAAC